jgi:hypothetical protein
MSLLERLKAEEPYMRNRKRSDRIYETTRELIPEIDEARARGYSWVQINGAAKAEFMEKGLCDEHWAHCNLQKNYNRIKAEGQTA